MSGRGKSSMTHGFFRELKRRHVYRVAVAYAVVGWLLTSTIVPALYLPASMTTTLVKLVLPGLPIALLLAKASLSKAWQHETDATPVRGGAGD
jgi:hypothetical protein